MLNETVQQAEENKVVIEKECANFITQLEGELTEAKRKKLVPEQIKKLEAQFESAKIANSKTLEDVEARLIQAREREQKANEQKTAEIEARSASEKAIMKAQMQGAWLREGGNLAGFNEAWEGMYQAEMVKRTMTKVSGAERHTEQAVRNLLAGH